ncbi:MAG: 50S ribosomal protein L15 [Candidatus Altiarchaeales archaeon ex4484_96]|nr:MAG: 50S ribosomal protein L15 [Candidatus Altiarchaeales archaeon ex4484_96]
MAHKDRKNHKHRGQRNQGYGSPQKHRGAGSRGGRGKAGGKKHKWSWFTKNAPGYYGGKGFKRPASVRHKQKTINVGDLDNSLEKLSSEKKIKVEGKKYIINLHEMGIEKLLGSGEVKNPMNITVKKHTPKAEEKIEKSGGSIVSPTESSKK